MREKTLHALNKRFEIFGRNPHGGLNFRWFNARDLDYMYECGTEEGKTPSGLFVIQTKWEKHSFADIYGPNWLLAKWQAPIPYSEWAKQIGTAFPWPRHGEYCPVESTVLRPGLEPDEDITQYTVYKLHQHLGMKAPDHLKRAYDEIEQRRKEDIGKWSDIVDDVMPAFGNVPGKKMHVSFGGV